VVNQQSLAPGGQRQMETPSLALVFVPDLITEEEEEEEEEGWGGPQPAEFLHRQL